MKPYSKIQQDPIINTNSRYHEIKARNNRREIEILKCVAQFVKDKKI